MTNTDKRCGNCRHFSPTDGPLESMCVLDVYHIAIPLPQWAKDAINESIENGVDSDDGADCDAWEQKQ